MKEKKSKEKNKDTETIDGIVLEPEDSHIDGLKENSVVRLRKKLKKCVSEKQEYLNGWQRAKADLINAKKDFEKQKSDFVKFAKGDLIIQIIPVLDSFDLALVNTKDIPKGWLNGIKHIYSQLLSILEDNGVKQINPLGEKFDVNQHNSVEFVKVDDESKESIILDVIQKGYLLNGKIIREARVKVGGL